MLLHSITFILFEKKQLFHRLWDHHKLIDHIKKLIEMGLYDKDILVNYDESEIDRMDMWIDHERDYNFTYAV